MDKDNVILEVIKQQRIAILVAQTDAAHVPLIPRNRIRRIQVAVALSSFSDNPAHIFIFDQRKTKADRTILIPINF